jgi:hypothetical protein
MHLFSKLLVKGARGVLDHLPRRRSTRERYFAADDIDLDGRGVGGRLAPERAFDLRALGWSVKRRKWRT